MREIERDAVILGLDAGEDGAMVPGLSFRLLSDAVGATPDRALALWATTPRRTGLAYSLGLEDQAPPVSGPNIPPGSGRSDVGNGRANTDDPTDEDPDGHDGTDSPVSRYKDAPVSPDTTGSPGGLGGPGGPALPARFAALLPVPDTAPVATPCPTPGKSPGGTTGMVASALRRAFDAGGLLAPPDAVDPEALQELAALERLPLVFRRGGGWAVIPVGGIAAAGIFLGLYPGILPFGLGMWLFLACTFLLVLCLAAIINDSAYLTLQRAGFLTRGLEELVPRARTIALEISGEAMPGAPPVISLIVALKPGYCPSFRADGAGKATFDPEKAC